MNPINPGRVLRVLFILALSLAGHGAFAQSVSGCGTGNQDSACVIKLSKASEVPPACPTGPGYPASPAPVWEGSYYSTNCSAYQAPQPCPSGYNEQTPPSWNGEAWVGQVCVPQTNPCPFGCAGDGMPYPVMLGYCGETKEQTILHVIHFTYSCTPSMAGLSRVNQGGTIVNGNGTLNYWNTPSSFTTTSSDTYRNVPGPAGTFVQTVDVVFGMIQYDPDDTGTDSSPFGEGNASGGAGSNEGWVFACPNAHPTINFATVAAYGQSNPTLIECQ